MNVGLLGAGNIARKMAKTIAAMDGVEVSAVAAQDLDRAQAFAQEFGIKRAYGSYDALLEDPQVNLVYVSTILPCHGRDMKRCLEYGKPVLCEKPFTLNAPEAREVLALGREKKLLVAEAIWTRYLPMRKVLDDLLARGAIGAPQSLTANIGEAVSHYPRLARPDLGGGAFMDMGVYTVNFALMAFGSAIKDIRSTMIPSETGVDAMSTTTLIYEDGKMAALHSTMRAWCDKRGTIFGDAGYVDFLNINNCEGIRVYDQDRTLTAAYETPPQITGFEYEVAACKRALEAGAVECAEMPHGEIIRVMDLMDRIRSLW